MNSKLHIKIIKCVLIKYTIGIIFLALFIILSKVWDEDS